MRFLPALVFLLPVPALADSFSLQSKITAVTVYPTAAKITRHASFSIPAGQHDLILPDLPAAIDFEYVRVQVEGARMGALTMREDYVPPRDDTTSPEVQAAKDRIEEIELQIEAVKDKAAQARLVADAAQAQIGFLGQIGNSDDMAAVGLDTLRDLSRMIAQEALAAQQSAHAARIDARRIERMLQDLQGDLGDAEQVLIALVPEDEERAYLSVSVNADGVTEGKLTVTYFSEDAMWEPAYDIYLTRGSAASVIMERGAIVRQNTGETWHGVKLTMSTVQPLSQIEPSILFTKRHVVEEPEPPRPELFERDAGSLAEPVIAAPVIVGYRALTRTNGYAVVYEYPVPVSIATAADAVHLELDRLTIGAEISAMAIPFRDKTAYLVAKTVNDSGEILLPSRSVSLFVDDVFVGLSRNFPGIAAGDEADLPFGSINGLRLERIVVNQNEGDRGIISRSNEQTRTIQIEITNLTNDTWPVRLLDRIPFSQQEELQITWSADPNVTDENVDNRRGILGWNFTLNPGESQMIQLDQTLSWPDGMILR